MVSRQIIKLTKNMKTNINFPFTLVLDDYTMIKTLIPFVTKCYLSINKLFTQIFRYISNIYYKYYISKYIEIIYYYFDTLCTPRRKCAYIINYNYIS